MRAPVRAHAWTNRPSRTCPHSSAARPGRGARHRAGEAGSCEAANVPPLPRRFDRTRVVVLANPTDRIVSGHAAKLSDARQRGSGASNAAPAGHFDAMAVGSQTMRFLEHRPRFVGARGKPQVRPTKPSIRPRRMSGPLAEQVEPPLRIGLQRGTLAETAAAKPRTIRQLHNARSKLPRHKAGS
jgi:hypothetical protein